MKKINKEFLNCKELLIVGYPAAEDVFMKGLLEACLNSGIKVFPLAFAEGSYNVKVYKALAELPKVPACAYIYLEKEHIQPVIRQLAESGVKRVLFHWKKDFDQGIIDECEKAGLEAAVGCPMMVLGKGYHKFHALLAGVR